MKTKRIAVLASGRGSNFQAVIDAVARGEIPATCCGLVTDNPDAYAIERARTAGIPVYIVAYGSYPSKEAYETALRRVMEDLAADLYILAGYMRILGSGIVKLFHGRLINIHPALLPAFPGLHAQRQALSYGVRVSGCTVHFVDDQYDHGPIILQRTVPVLDGDTAETLAHRVFDAECEALPAALALIVAGRVHVEGRHVRIAGR